METWFYLDMVLGSLVDMALLEQEVGPGDHQRSLHLNHSVILSCGGDGKAEVNMNRGCLRFLHWERLMNRSLSHEKISCFSLLKIKDFITCLIKLKVFKILNFCASKYTAF